MPSDILLPTGSVPISARNEAKLEMALPFMVTITSPALMPAFAAEDFGITADEGPALRVDLHRLGQLRVQLGTHDAQLAAFHRPYSTICAVRFFTMLLGMAKPIPMLPPSGADRCVDADQLTVQVNQRPQSYRG